MGSWMVMSAVIFGENNGTCFDSNATGLSTEAQATAEAKRRNAAEAAAGHTGITWFPAEDPMAVLQRSGFKGWVR